MKKDYMKPEGVVVALRMNENISASLGGNLGDNFGIHYTIVGEKKYIYGDMNCPASSTGDERYDRWYDLIISYINNVDPNCRFDPDEQ